MFDSAITGKRIREERKATGWTQAALCQRINEMSRESIYEQRLSSYENGGTNVPLAVLVVLADIFNVTTDYLLGVSDDPNPYAAKVTEYTGLSPKAAKVLHNMLKGDGGNSVSLSVLNDLVLSPGFHSTLFSMYLLRRRAEEIENIDLRVPETDEEERMHFRRDYGLYRAANDKYGVAVILKNMDAVNYEADRIVWRFRNMVTSICGVRKAARIWAKKCADEHAEYNRRFAEEET